MAVKIPLKMSDGAVVRTIEDLREHFDFEAVLGYYSSGRLAEWLEERYCEKEAAEVRKLEADAKDFNETLCAVLGVTYEKKAGDKTDLSHVRKKNERLGKVKKYTMNDEILSAVDWVAFTQKELDSLLKKIKTQNENEKRVIYLCGESFIVPANVGNVIYKGVNNPVVEIRGDIVEYGIELQDVRCDSKKCGSERETTERVREEAESSRLKPEKEAEKKEIKATETENKAKIEKSLKHYKELAELGDAEAQYQLGVHYQYGRDIKKDEEEAAKWYRKAAEQEHVKAMIALRKCYMDGVGVSVDFSEACKWKWRAIDHYLADAEKGDANAQYGLGYVYNSVNDYDDEEDALKWYRKAAEQGHAEAQFELGGRYWIGWSVEKNAEEAAKWYQKAAEQGHMEAQVALGKCYLVGIGMIQSADKAVEWCEKAAEQGFQYAKDLALKIRQGKGVAQCELGNCYSGGDGVEKNEKKAVECWREAAEQGYAEAQYELGQCYEWGRGVKASKREAKKWLKMAAEQGYEFAKISLQNL